MSDKPSKHDTHHQFGNAAQNSARADNLHRRKLIAPAFVGLHRPVYEVDGSCARKPASNPPPPKRQERYAAEEPKAPIRVGEKFNVRVEVVKSGITRFIEGVMEVMESMWIFTTWVFKVKIRGIEQFFLWRLDWIMAGRAAWWSRPRQIKIEVGKVSSQSPTSIALLPAPRTTIAGLLPARCA